MDMNKAFFLKAQDANPQWRVIDAKGKILGRLATEISIILRGKDQVEYTKHTLSGDYVVVINAAQVVLSGNKMDNKVHLSYSGYQGGQKSRTPREIMKKDPTQLLYLAVKRMMSKINKSPLSRQTLKRLKIYAGDVHPHTAQITK